MSEERAVLLDSYRNHGESAGYYWYYVTPVNSLDQLRWVVVSSPDVEFSNLIIVKPIPDTDWVGAHWAVLSE